jgi:hypothetical protein
MADAFVALLSDPERARDVGMAARERVRSKFTIQQSAAKIDFVYRSVLHRPKSNKNNPTTEPSPSAPLLNGPETQL